MTEDPFVAGAHLFQRDKSTEATAVENLPGFSAGLNESYFLYYRNVELGGVCAVIRAGCWSTKLETKVTFWSNNNTVPFASLARIVFSQAVAQIPDS